MNEDELTQEALNDLADLAEDRNDPIDLYKRTIEQIRDGLEEAWEKGDDRAVEQVAKLNLQ